MTQNIKGNPVGAKLIQVQSGSVDVEVAAPGDVDFNGIDNNFDFEPIVMGYVNLPASVALTDPSGRSYNRLNFLVLGSPANTNFIKALYIVKPADITFWVLTGSVVSASTVVGTWRFFYHIYRLQAD
jgi:hypothetical protein